MFFFFLLLLFYFFFFFFQAEDGIRDTSVTGVQTCALPICGLTNFAEFGISRDELVGPSHKAKFVRPRHVAMARARETGASFPKIGKAFEIGRASCRERVEMWVGAGGVKRKRGEVGGTRVSR